MMPRGIRKKTEQAVTEKKVVAKRNEYKSGEAAKIGDIIKFKISGDLYFGEVKRVHKDGDVDVVHVMHTPKAVEYHIVIKNAELAHRN